MSDTLFMTNQSFHNTVPTGNHNGAADMYIMELNNTEMFALYIITSWLQWNFYFYFSFSVVSLGISLMQKYYNSLYDITTYA